MGIIKERIANETIKKAKANPRLSVIADLLDNLPEYDLPTEEHERRKNAIPPEKKEEFEKLWVRTAIHVLADEIQKISS